MHDNEWLAQRFEEDRGRMISIASRMLGSASDADDAVQGAWLRLSHSDADAIENLGSWLTTVLSRVCLNILQARRSRPETPLDVDRLEAPADEAPELDPEQEVLVADSIGLALTIMLDTLSPGERVAFVLHDIFGVPFEEIAPIVGRSDTAARKLASRARRRVRMQDADQATNTLREAKLVAAFLAAARNREFDQLLAVLDPDVVLRRSNSRHVGRAVRGPRSAGRRPVLPASTRRSTGSPQWRSSGSVGAWWAATRGLQVHCRRREDHCDRPDRRPGPPPPT